MKNLNEPLKREQDVVPFERKAPSEIDRASGSPGPDSLLPHREMGELRGRWSSIQSSFVDEPRKAVQEADNLVQLAIKQIEDGFAAERAELEKQWSRGDKVSTEDLRVCLQHYRTFFDRLLSNV